MIFFNKPSVPRLIETEVFKIPTANNARGRQGKRPIGDTIVRVPQFILVERADGAKLLYANDFTKEPTGKATPIMLRAQLAALGRS